MMSSCQLCWSDRIFCYIRHNVAWLAVNEIVQILPKVVNKLPQQYSYAWEIFLFSALCVGINLNR